MQSSSSLEGMFITLPISARFVTTRSNFNKLMRGGVVGRSLLLVYRKHRESIGQDGFLRIPLGRSWGRLTTQLLFAVSVLLLAGCASNRRQQQHSSDTPFFDSPDVESLH